MDVLNEEESKKLRLELETYQMEGAKIYSIVGKFIFEFQEVCYSIKNCIYKGLTNNGLNNTDLAKNILEHNSAYNLANSFKSFYHDFNPNDTEGKKILDKLIDRFIKINNVRNDLVHGDISVIFITNSGKTIAYVSGQRLKATKFGISNIFKENHLNGEKYEIGYYNEMYFGNLGNELKQLRAFFA